MEGFLLKMAFEISEGLYAGLSLIPTGELQSAVRDKEKFLSLLEVAQSNLSGSGVLDASGNATKNGMLSTIKSKTDKEKYDNLAAAISAVLATRSKVNGDIPSAVYLTGNQWHSDVEKFKISAYGMSDYNSSDVILRYGNLYNGISLKKKPNAAAESPTLINNAFSTFIGGPVFKKVRDDLNDYRIKFFASVIKDAFSPGQPLSKFAELPQYRSLQSLNPNIINDAKVLWEMKVNVEGKPRPIPLINAKSQSSMVGIDGLMSSLGESPPQKDFRLFVNTKLQSGPNNVNPLFQGFLSIMNRPDAKDKISNVLLTRVLKLNLLDELDVWASADFGFYLVEGVGSVQPNLTPNISSGSVLNLHSIVVAIAKLTKQPTRIEFDSTKTGERNAAKVFFKMYKGNTPILDLELRYKGDFSSYPQFFAFLTPEFKGIISNTGPVTRFI